MLLCFFISQKNFPFQLPSMSTIQGTFLNFQLEQVLQLRSSFLLHKSTLLTKYFSTKTLMAFENTRLAANKGNPYKVPFASLSHIISSIVFNFVLLFVNRLSIQFVLACRSGVVCQSVSTALLLYP